MPPPTERYHALDGLRGAAMFLGVVLHAALPYMVKPPAFWPVKDAGSPVVDLFLFAVHDFRMQLFFVLAGFFGGMLHRRYGTRELVRHRLRRIALPLAVGVLTVVPVTLAVAVYAEVAAFRADGIPDGATDFRRKVAELAADPDRPTWLVTTDFFTRGWVLFALLPLHLWFLYYLLWFYAAAAVALPLLARLAGTRIEAAADRWFRWAVASRFGWISLVVATVPAFTAMPGLYVDTPAGWTPNLPLMAYYLGFFAFGWMLDRHRDLAPAFGRAWGRGLLVANGLVFPTTVAVVMIGTEARAADGSIPTGWRVTAATASALYTWLMVAGLWGLFLAKLPGERRWVRYLADSSYWCYVASLPPTMLFPLLLLPVPVPWPVKLAVSSVATIAVLLASYEWCVRYTLIGAVLNGRKHRPGAVIPTSPNA